ncbi:MAG: FecR domain-containing protein [Candidatus Latescibacteria bacterium]|nr:FecR domain-containing protein [Candidatus Latescibacterota bacterium]
MKHTFLVGCGILIGLFATSSMAAEKEPLGSVTFMIGDVDIQKCGKTDWADAELEQPTYEKDKVKTQEESRCEVTLTDEKILRIGEKTVFEILREPDGNAKVGVKSGKVWMNIRSLVEKEQFEVATPTAVAAIRGTVYRLSCDANHSSYRVYEGSVAVTPFKEDGKTLEDSTFTVHVGEEFTVVKDFEEYKRQQKEALKKFKKSEKEKLKEFERQQREGFKEFKQKEEAAFQKFKSLHVELKSFDTEKDRKLDWVKFNLERDKKLER